MGKYKDEYKVIAWAFSHKTFVVASLFVLIFAMLFVWAWMGRTTIQISFKDGLPPQIETVSGYKVPGMQVLPNPPIDETMIPINMLPESLQIDRGKAISKIIELERRSRERRDNIWDCCDIIGKHIAAHASIDTTLVGDEKKEVYRCIQILLKTINCYDGQIDGDQSRTREAVVKFQKDKRLEVDSKVGVRTFKAMIIELAKNIIR